MARRLIITENITLDSVLENDRSWFDPTDDSGQGRELAEVTREHAAPSDGFLVGHTTFEKIRELTAREDRDIVLTGSIPLVQQLLAAGMVDELRLFVFPVVPGTGRRLLPEGTTLRDLTLAETRAFSGGVVLLRYTR